MINSGTRVIVSLKVTLLLVMCGSLASTVSDSENDDDAFVRPIASWFILIRGSTFIDNTAVQPRAVWSAGLFCGGSIIVEQSTAHHKRSRHIDNI